ncbi:MAG TPA: hypothetical protein VFI02_15620 [Armatimonadota bacterium]|nr:hypothetical protein [Armatimonadota bacterium]
MPKINPAFAEAIDEILKRHELSYRGASYRTGVNHTTILAMTKGYIPGKGIIVDFAVGLKENVNDLMEAAGYDRIPTEYVCDVTADQVREELLEYLVDAKRLKPEDIEQIRKELEEK